MHLRRFLLLGAVAAATPVCVAAAAGLGLGSSGLGAGAAAVGRCDGDGVTVGYTTVGGNVTAVTVGGIADPACEGAALSLEVLDGTGTSIASGSATVATDGDTLDNAQSVGVTPQPAAEAPSSVHVALVGP